MDKTAHTQETEREHSNPEFYRTIPEGTMQALKDATSRNTEKDLFSWALRNPDQAPFYLLFKIYQCDNPRWPIVSGVGIITKGVSGSIYSILLPCASGAASKLPK